jgi:hypothetical protein
VVVYLPDDEFHVAELINLHQANENLRKYADFHIVFEISVSFGSNICERNTHNKMICLLILVIYFDCHHKLPYPANHLRNVALINARTDYVITLDVDFIPNLDMHKQLKYASSPFFFLFFFVVPKST